MDRKIASHAIQFLIDNIDTDQIIPARFLKTTHKEGLGEHLFADWRFTADGKPVEDFILNQSENSGATILVAGENFGCGSSREHALWALNDFGFSVVIARSFADIFRNNAVKNNILTVELNPNDHQTLVDTLQEIPDAQIEVDIDAERINLPTGVGISFSIEPFVKKAITEGIDELTFLVSCLPDIERYEKQQESFQ